MSEFWLDALKCPTPNNNVGEIFHIVGGALKRAVEKNMGGDTIGWRGVLVIVDL